MTIQELLTRALVYAPTTDEEALRIDMVDIDEQKVYCTGEESGEEYCVGIDEFDIDNAIFYELSPIETKMYRLIIDGISIYVTNKQITDGIGDNATLNEACQMARSEMLHKEALGLMSTFGIYQIQIDQIIDRR